MEQYIPYIIIGAIIGTIIGGIKLFLYFRKGIDTTRHGFSAFTPLAILMGIIYGFYDDK